MKLAGNPRALSSSRRAAVIVQCPPQPGSPAPARAGVHTARRGVSEFCQIIRGRVRSPPPSDATIVAVSDPLTFSRARVRILSFRRATMELLRLAEDSRHVGW